MLVRNELLESDHMFVLREHREKNLNDVTVSSTYPPPAEWHSLLFVEDHYPLKLVSKTEVALIPPIATDVVMCHRCGFSKGGDE